MFLERKGIKACNQLGKYGEADGFKFYSLVLEKSQIFYLKIFFIANEEQTLPATHRWNCKSLYSALSNLFVVIQTWNSFLFQVAGSPQLKKNWFT